MAATLDAPPAVDPDADRLLNVKEVSALLGLSRSSLYVLMDSGKLRFCRLPSATGSRSNRRLKKSDVLALIEQCMSSPSGNPSGGD